jgi:hypothetical protein
MTSLVRSRPYHEPMNRSFPASRATSEYLPEFGRPGTSSTSGPKVTAHLIRRGKSASIRRVTLEEAIPELRELLEENLAGLRAIYDEQRRAISLSLQTAGAPADELHALAQPSSPWVFALDQTRRMIRASFLEIAASHVRAARTGR